MIVGPMDIVEFQESSVKKSKGNIQEALFIGTTEEGFITSRSFNFDALVSRSVGTLPSSSKSYKYSRKWALYSGVVVSLLFTLEIKRMVRLLQGPILQSIMESCVKILRMSVIFFQFLAIKCRGKSFELILRNLSDPESTKLVSRIWTVFGFLVIYFYFGSIAIFSWILTKDRTAPIKMLNKILSFLIIIVSSSTLEFSIFMILRQFCIIINIVQRKVSKLTKKLESSCSKYAVESLCQEHYKFIILSRKANNFYSLQLLAVCTYMFVRMLYLIFETLSINLEEAEKWMQVMRISVNIIHTIAILIFLLMLTSSCENAIEENNAFHRVLFKYITEQPNLDRDGKIQFYVEMFPSMEFTACNFFGIGYSLVTSIVAAVSTYLVVIIQAV